MRHFTPGRKGKPERMTQSNAKARCKRCRGSLFVETDPKRNSSSPQGWPLTNAHVFHSLDARRGELWRAFGEDMGRPDGACRGRHLPSSRDIVVSCRGTSRTIVRSVRTPVETDTGCVTAFVPVAF